MVELERRRTRRYIVVSEVEITRRNAAAVMFNSRIFRIDVISLYIFCRWQIASSTVSVSVDCG